MAKSTLKPAYLNEKAKLKDAYDNDPTKCGYIYKEPPPLEQCMNPSDIMNDATANLDVSFISTPLKVKGDNN